MGLRTDLHELLCTALGSRNVYFQPPEGFKLAYPCIVYEVDRIITLYANDKPYSHSTRYTVTAIDRNPDSQIPKRIADFPTAAFKQQFEVDNLHHYVYQLYY